MSSYDITSLNDFIVRKQKDFPYATGELSSLLHHIGTAAKMVNAKIRKAGLVEILGKAGAENPQGEEQQKLDRYADEVFIDALRSSGQCAGRCLRGKSERGNLYRRVFRKGIYSMIDPLDVHQTLTSTCQSVRFLIYRPSTERMQRQRHRLSSVREQQVFRIRDLRSSRCWYILQATG